MFYFFTKIWIYVPLSMHGGQKKGLDPLGLELHVIVNILLCAGNQTAALESSELTEINQTYFFIW